MNRIFALLLPLFFILVSAPAQDDHGNDAFTATEISAPEIQGNLEIETDEDWFRFTVTNAGRYWIYTTGDVDTIGTLYREPLVLQSGSVSERDRGGQDNFLINRILQPGNYFLRVAFQGGSRTSTGPYVLGFRNFENAVTLEKSDTPAAFEVLGDRDLYRFTTSTPGRTWIYTTGSTDTIGTLYNSVGDDISTSFSGDNDGESDNFQRSFQLQPGTYYLDVSSGFAGNANLTGNYTLCLRTPDNARTFNTSDLDASLGTIGELDLYRIEISDTSRFWIYSTGSTDTFASFYDSTGALSPLTSDDSGSSFNFEISAVRQPGTYYLLVEDGGNVNKIGSYGLHLRNNAHSKTLLESGMSSEDLSTFGQLDLFKFSTLGGNAIFGSSGNTDTQAFLYDSTGAVIAGNGSTHNRNGRNFEFSRDLAAGNYQLLIRGENRDLTRGEYALETSFAAGEFTGLSEGGIVVAGDSSQVEIISTTSWSVGDLPSWITASQAEGNGSGALGLSYAPNLSGVPRSATISIGGQAYTITQRPQGDTTGESFSVQTTIAEGVLITVPTAAGITYEIETSNDMATWLPTGITLQGDGLPHTKAFSRAEARAFFRAVPVR